MPLPHTLCPNCLALLLPPFLQTCKTLVKHSKMKSLKTLYSSRHWYKFLKPQTPSFLARNPHHNSSTHFPIYSNIPKIGSNLKFPIPISYSQRNFSACAELASKDDTFEDQSEVEKVEFKKKWKKLVGVKGNGGDGLGGIIEIMSEKIEENGSVEMELKKGEVPIDIQLREIEELKKKIVKLEKEVRSLKGKTQNSNAMKKKKESVKLEEHTTDKLKPKTSSLHAVFTSNSSSLPTVKVEKITRSVASGEKKIKKRPVVSGEEKIKKEKTIMKELSPEMVALVSRLHEDGYLSNLKNAPSDELDLIAFTKRCHRSVLRSMAEKFGRDHQQIAKWLSGSDLKTVALSGCPTLEKNTVFAAKGLRSFFKIQEDVVCQGCKMKSSCKFANKRNWPQQDELKLTDAMRVLASYSLESVPEFPISTEVRNSISKLLTEALNLSK